MKRIKEFDIVQLRKKYKAINNWFEDQVSNGEIRNDTGVQYTVDDDDDEEMDKALIKLGAKSGETVLLWVSW